jgi:hypothetical protein
MDGQSWPSNVSLHKAIQNSSIFGQKKITSLWNCSQPCLLCFVPQFCKMGTESSSEVELLDAAKA